MGHEDILMLSAIVSSVLLQITGAFPDLPSWFPAIAGGLYKYSVDIKREYGGNSKSGGKVDNEGTILIRADVVEVETDKIKVVMTK